MRMFMQGGGNTKIKLHAEFYAKIKREAQVEYNGGILYKIATRMKHRAISLLFPLIANSLVSPK